MLAGGDYRGGLPVTGGRFCLGITVDYITTIILVILLTILIMRSIVIVRLLSMVITRPQGFT